jgi:signal peptidase
MAAAATRDARRARHDHAKDASTTSGFVARARATLDDWRGGFVRSLKQATERQAVLQWLSLALIVTSALMLWKVLVLSTRSESPVVVVLSGSMEPGLRRGDLLLLENRPRPTEIGEVVVFNIRGRSVPIVHRIIRAHDALKGGGGERLMLTKGDNNYADDVGLYAPGQRWLTEQDVIGRARVFLPHVGRLTILMNDHPWFKVALISILGYFVVTGKD